MFLINQLSLLFSLLIIACKIAIFNDKWGIHKEARILSRLLMFGVALFLICATITAYLNNNNDYKSLGLVFTVFTWFELSLLWIIMGFVSIWHALSFNEHQLIPDPNDASTTSGDAVDLSITSSSNIEFNRILSNEKQLNAFVNYLSKEFSIETLTSYIEFTQFQHFLILNNKVDSANMKSNVVFADSVPLSNLLPEIKRGRSNIMDLDGDDVKVEMGKLTKIYKGIGSQIVMTREEEKEIETETKEDDEELIDFKYRIHELWKKYVKPSPNEINISDQDRMQLEQALGDCDRLISNSLIGYDQLFQLLEIVRYEMEQLLKDSMKRFEN